MKEKALKTLIALAIKIMSEQDLKVWADKAIDMIEDKVEDSTTPWDDKIFLPVCGMVRKAFDIPDND